MCPCSFRQQKALAWNSKKVDCSGTQLEKVDSLDDDMSKPTAANYGEIQLETFHYRQGILLLHLVTSVMLGPSLVAWVQVGPAFLCLYVAYLSAESAAMRIWSVTSLANINAMHVQF